MVPVSVEKKITKSPVFPIPIYNYLIILLYPLFLLKILSIK